jgi:hypothetical protein
VSVAELKVVHEVAHHAVEAGHRMICPGQCWRMVPS